MICIKKLGQIHHPTPHQSGFATPLIVDQEERCNFPFRKQSLPTETVIANMFLPSPSVPFSPYLYNSHQPETRSKFSTCFLSFTLNSTTDYLGLPYPNRNPNLTVPVADFPSRLYPNLTTSRLIILILTF